MTAPSPFPLFDSILLASYGAPESPEQIDPFLNAITGGKGIPVARVAAVRARYEAIGGRSPLMGECRLLCERLEAALHADGVEMPKIYCGALYASPTLEDAFAAMARDHRRSTLVVHGSAFGSSVSCRRYRAAVERACAKIMPEAPRLVFLPPFFDHPQYRRAVADSVLEALAWDQLAANPFSAQSDERLLLFTAHSLPLADAERPRYREQLATACNGVLRAILSAPAFGADGKSAKPADYDPRAPIALDYELAPDLRAQLRARALDVALAFQSRSGAPTTPWLEPDVKLLLHEYKERRPALKRVIVVPIGFLFENMETIYDLDVELRAVCDALDLSYRRAQCVGATERLARMFLELARLARGAMPSCESRAAECDFSCRLAPTQDSGSSSDSFALSATSAFMKE